VSIDIENVFMEIETGVLSMLIEMRGISALIDIQILSMEIEIRVLSALIEMRGISVLID
jgi:hypothetical protein